MQKNKEKNKLWKTTVNLSYLEYKDLFVFHFMMLQEKKVMLKGLVVLHTSVFLQLPKRTTFICQNSEQNRLDDFVYVYMLIYAQPHTI